MSGLKAWHGFQLRAGLPTTEEVVIAAKTAKDAAKWVKIKPSDFPFRFTVFPLPRTADRPGLYRNVGGAWVRDEQVTGSIGPELRELLQSAPMSALAALRVAATYDVNRAIQAVFAEVAEGDRQLAEDTWNRWSK